MSTKKFTLKLINEILITFFPEHCLGCSTILHSGEIGFCKNCFNSLTYVNLSNVCPICFSRKHKKSDEECIENSSLDRNISLLPFDDITQTLIHEIKYYFRVRLLKAFLDQLPFFELYGEKPDIILPVPLHKHRLKWREFNQSEIIAQWIARRTHIPYTAEILIRNKNTPPQSQLAHNERKVNVDNAFSIQNAVSLPENVLLVDDVMTTGETLIACAEVLKNKGVKRVVSYTLLRA